MSAIVKPAERADGGEASAFARILPVGAEPQMEGGTHFRVWAPGRKQVCVLLENESQRQAFDLRKEADGYCSEYVPEAAPGMNYWIQLDGQEPLPDPASRYQPQGPTGPSQIVDPAQYVWHDDEWRGARLPGQVLYEMHVGTFTPDGNWQGATERLDDLMNVGITAIELMPVVEFPGEYGWSYDGANIFAPSHLYGTPDDFRRFVDRAHGYGLTVILDVVFNHFGALGEKLIEQFSQAYFSKRHQTEWGRALNFDDEQSGPVRDFVLGNLRMWIREYHLDGVRIDATQAFFDDSKRSILLELGCTAREAARGRSVITIAESEPQKASLLRSCDTGGCQLDGAWADDFHHSAMARLTGRSEAYYTDHRGTAEEFLAAAKWGYLFQGQRYHWHQAPRGTPALDLPRWAFIHYLQNHDQIANSVRGLRVHELTSPGRYRAMTALWLLMPQTPLVFQGQEFAASSPFLYFNDAPADEVEGVREGRKKFMSQFRSAKLPEIQERLADPADRRTFEKCKLNWAERSEGAHAEALALHRDLLALRKTLRPDAVSMDGATVGDDLLILRYKLESAESWLLIVNFGAQMCPQSIAQPLVAPPAGRRWMVAWSSEDPRYGGNGAADPETDEGWKILGEWAVMLKATQDPP